VSSATLPSLSWSRRHQLGPRLRRRFARAARRGAALLPHAEVARLGDAELLDELRRRARRADRAGADLFASFAADAMPVRELDYGRVPLRLRVTSPWVWSRLRSVEKEPFTVEWIEHSVQTDDVFYDIGANVGAYALIAAQRTENVFAFEPSPATYRDLAENVVLNGCDSNVTTLPLALWSETRLLSLDARSREPGAARHRLLEDAPSGSVVGASLDDLVERVGLPTPTHAKIDVDGAEYEVLVGAERTLRRREWRSLLIELDAAETDRNVAVRALLDDAGFDSSERHAAEPKVPGRERHVAYWTFSRS
jgi:FkbM family methyltransferase